MNRLNTLVFCLCVMCGSALSQEGPTVRYLSRGLASDGRPVLNAFLPIVDTPSHISSYDWSRARIFERSTEMPVIGVRAPATDESSCFDLVLLTDNTHILPAGILDSLKESGRRLVNTLLPLGSTCRKLGLITYDNAPFIRSFLTTNGTRVTAEIDAMTRATISGRALIDGVRAAQIELSIRSTEDTRYILLTGTGSRDSSRNRLADILPSDIPLHTAPRILTVAIGEDSGADTLRMIYRGNGGLHYRADAANLESKYDSIAHLLMSDLNEYRITFRAADSTQTSRDVVVALPGMGRTVGSDFHRIEPDDPLSTPVVMRWPRMHWAVYPDTLRIDSMWYEWCAHVAGSDSTIVLPSDGNGTDSSITLTAEMLRSLVFENNALNPSASSVVELHWFVRSRLTYHNGVTQTTVTVTSDTAGISQSTTHHVPSPLVLSFNQVPVAPDSQQVEPPDGARVYGVDPSTTITVRWQPAVDSNLVHGAKLGGFSSFDVQSNEWVRDTNRTVDTLRYQWVGVVTHAVPDGARGPVPDTLVFDAETATELLLDSRHLSAVFGSLHPDSGADVVRLSWFVRVGDGSTQTLQSITDRSDLLLTRSQPPLPFFLSTTSSQNRHFHRMDHVGTCDPDSSNEADKLVLFWEEARWPVSNGAYTKSDTIKYEWRAEIVRPTPFTDDSAQTRTHSIALPSDSNGTQPRITLGGSALKQLFFAHVNGTNADSLVAVLRWHVRAYGVTTGLEVFSDTTGVTVGTGGWNPTPPLVLSYNRPPDATIQVLDPPTGKEIFVDLQNPDLRFSWSAALDSNLIQGRRLNGFRTFDPGIPAWKPATDRTVDTVRYAVVLTAVDGSDTTVLVRAVAADSTTLRLVPFDLLSLKLDQRGRIPLTWHVLAIDGPISSDPMADTARWSRYGCRPHVLIAGPFTTTLVARPTRFALNTTSDQNPTLLRMVHTGGCAGDGLEKDTLRLRWQPIQLAGGGTSDTVRYAWHALIDSVDTIVTRTVASDGLGVHSRLTLTGEEVRSVLFPTQQNPDSLVMRVKWFVRAYTQSGLDVYSDTAGVTLATEVPTPPLVVSINTPPTGKPVPVTPQGDATVSGVNAATDSIRFEWTPAEDPNVQGGITIGGFKIPSDDSAWVDEAGRTIDTLRYEWVGIVRATEPKGTGADSGTTFTHPVGTSTHTMLSQDEIGRMFGGFGADAAMIVSMDWFVRVRDGIAAGDSCRPRETVAGPFRFNLTREALGGVEMSPVSSDGDIDTLVGSSIRFVLTVKDKQRNIIRDWDQTGHATTIAIRNSRANSDTSIKSWSSDPLGFTYAVITHNGVPLAPIGASEFVLPNSAFVDGEAEVHLTHTRADSGVYLETSPILADLDQTSAKMNFAAGTLQNYLVDLTSATAPTPDQVYVQRRYEIVVTPRDKYLNAVNGIFTTRFDALYRGEFDLKEPGLTDIFAGDMTITGTTHYLLKSSRARERQSRDTLQWVRASSVGNGGVFGMTSPYEVLTHAPNLFALTAPVDKAVLKLNQTSTLELFQWVKAVPQDPYTNIQISRSDRGTVSDHVTYEVVFRVDSANQQRERRVPANDNGNEVRLIVTHGWLVEMMNELSGVIHTKALAIVWHVEATDGIFTTLSTPPLNDPAQRSGHRLSLVREGILDVTEAETPTTFELYQNHPNPFAALTTIAYALPEAGAVRLEVYDMRGAVVRTLVDEHRAAGTHAISWDGRDDRGLALPSGTYLTRLIAGGRALVRRMTIIR